MWITSQITDVGNVANATLTYTYGSGNGTASTPFTESFGNTDIKPWTGIAGSGGNGADNTWTIGNGSNSFELHLGSDYTGNSTLCGLEFKASTSSNATITTANAINAAGTSGYIEFYVQDLTIAPTDSSALQVDTSGNGSNFVTRMSETGANQGFTKYDYTLAPSELVSTLRLRFVFTGNGATDTGRIDLDQISVNIVTGGKVTATVPMYDDGLHGDGAAGDHVYGAQIPALANGTPVSYYVTANGHDGTDDQRPRGRPRQPLFVYRRAANRPAAHRGQRGQRPPNPVTGTTAVLSVLGNDVDTGANSLTYT